MLEQSKLWLHSHCKRYGAAISALRKSLLAQKVSLSQPLHPQTLVITQSADSREYLKELFERKQKLHSDWDEVVWIHSAVIFLFCVFSLPQANPFPVKTCSTRSRRAQFEPALPDLSHRSSSSPVTHSSSVGCMSGISYFPTESIDSS